MNDLCDIGETVICDGGRGTRHFLRNTPHPASDRKGELGDRECYSRSETWNQLHDKLASILDSVKWAPMIGFPYSAISL